MSFNKLINFITCISILNYVLLLIIIMVNYQIKCFFNFYKVPIFIFIFSQITIYHVLIHYKIQNLELIIKLDQTKIHHFINIFGYKKFMV